MIYNRNDIFTINLQKIMLKLKLSNDTLSSSGGLRDTLIDT